MKTPYEMHVISNTHWDREWSCNFQETRMQLAEFMDDLLDILDSEPRYRAFHLDSQAVPVEDYLEARPENRERVERHVKEGRLLIGPWYTCPEEFSVSGESIARNLLYGHRVARQFGGVMKVGYSPFSYGQTSQMPQIYQGFGIDTILFYHGVTHDEMPNEFIFEGPDGTQILASQMSAYARYNFYHGVYRKVVWGDTTDARVYTWDMGGVPFHRCTADRCDDHHVLLEPEAQFARERIKECVQTLREKEAAIATTPYLAFMMGHDASVADAAVVRIIEEAQQYVGKDKLFHSTLPDLMAKVKKSAKDLPVLKGERRTPKVRGGLVHLNSNVLSSRSRMKRLNALAEDILQRRAEPYATIAWCLGAAYPSALLDVAWKELLKGHAHDTISSSGVDDIERDMMHRLRQVVNIAQGLTGRSLAHIQRSIDPGKVPENTVLLTAFNASPHGRSEVLTAVLDVPRGSVPQAFGLIEAQGGKAVPVQVATRKPHHVVVNHPGDVAHTMACERITCHFPAVAPPLGYTTFRVGPNAPLDHDGLVCRCNTMENEHLGVSIAGDGTLSVTHKETGAQYDGLHYFEDGGEGGNAWKHLEPAVDRVITSHGCPVSVALEENGPLLARYRIEYRMTIPRGLDENGGSAWDRLDGFDNASRRTEETCDLAITSTVTLRKGARSVEVETRFHNAAEHHRLRVLFPTRLSKAKTCHAEGAFDVVERPIEHAPGSPWHGVGPRTFPMQRFVDVSDGKAGLGIVTEGLREYHVTPDAERAIAVTLLRAFEVAVCTSAAGWEIHPDMKLSQSPGDHVFRYAIYPHAGRWDEAAIHREVERLTVPVELAQVGAASGRVQRPLPKRWSFLEVQPTNLLMSALKPADCDWTSAEICQAPGQAIVLRLFNPTEMRIDGTVKCHSRICSAELLTLEETPTRKLKPTGKSLKLQVDSRKIVTVRLSFF